ncbi:NADAR family protein [Bacillus sp. AFS029533]|uniref:NADAR family protein n=1 Tax=Bacillus sp. AFS029533 TaxID=2033494 RepID=UPI0015D4BCA8|nr:NADAR family protein [Bacillus sp. AFS029533]
MRETNHFVFFWKGDDIFSNFYYAPFIHQGIEFKWSEQAVMYRKAKLFGADEIALQILKAKTPKMCKDLGRSRQIPFREDVWKNARETIYKEVLVDKFSVPKLKAKLLATGDKILAEASPYDTIWGIGYAENHCYAEDPAKWIGLNLLGKVLMEVRGELAEKVSVQEK